MVEYDSLCKYYLDKGGMFSGTNRRPLAMQFYRQTFQFHNPHLFSLRCLRNFWTGRTPHVHGHRSAPPPPGQRTEITGRWALVGGTLPCGWWRTQTPPPGLLAFPLAPILLRRRRRILPWTVLWLVGEVDQASFLVRKPQGGRG